MIPKTPYCPVCGRVVEKSNTSGEWVHSGICNYLITTHSLYRDGRVEISENAKDALKAIYEKINHTEE